RPAESVQRHRAVAEFVDDIAGVEPPVQDMLFLGRHGGRYRHEDTGSVLGRVLQIHAVHVLRPALADVGEAGAAVAADLFVDDHLPLVRPGHTEVDAVDDQAVVGRVGGGHAVVQHGAGALDVARHHGTGHVACDV